MKIKIHVKSKFFQVIHYVIPFLLSFLIGIPTVDLPYRLVNDGAIINYYREVLKMFHTDNWGGILKTLYHLDSGRFFPAYDIINVASLITFGESFIAQRLVHLSFSIITFFCVYTMVYKLTKKIWVAALSISIFGICPLFYEKWFRIGAPEIRITAFLSISILLFYLSSKNISFKYRLYFILSTLLLPLIYFSKEVTIAFIPSIGILCMLTLAFDNNFVVRRRVVIYFFSHVFSCSIYFLLRAVLRFSIITGNYSKKYTTHASELFPIVNQNIDYYFNHLYQTYTIFLFIPLGLWLYYLSCILYNYKKNGELQKNDTEYLTWSTTFLVLFLSTIIIYLPWNLSTPIYLVQTVYAFSIFFGISLNKLFKSKAGCLKLSIPSSLLNLLTTIFIIFFILMVVIPNGLEMFNSSQIKRNNIELHHEIISYLAKTVSRQHIVWTTIPPIEPLQKAQLNLRIFHKRSDISVNGISWDGIINYYTSKDKKKQVTLQANDILAITKPIGPTVDRKLWSLIESYKTTHFEHLKTIKHSIVHVDKSILDWSLLFPPYKGFLAKLKQSLKNFDISCSFYKVLKPLAVSYALLPHSYQYKPHSMPFHSTGFYADGWITKNNEITLHVPERYSEFQIKGNIPPWAEFKYPYVFSLKSNSGWEKQIQIVKPGNFCWSHHFEDKSSFSQYSKVTLSLVADQFAIPARKLPSSNDNRRILFSFTFIGFK